MTENILTDGPFDDSDWWRVIPVTEKCSSDDNFPFFTDDDVLQQDQQQHYRTDNNRQAIEACIEQKPEHSGSTVTENSTITTTPVEFYNCGYATWVQVRHAWKNSSNNTTVSAASTNLSKSISSKSPPALSSSPSVIVTESVRSDLVKCIKDRRHFELSRSIPLKIIINAYNEAWADGEGL
jgi:hypothetical protein